MEKNTGRVEAFSDGVFAIAITLLILEIRVPHVDPASNDGLWRGLAALWPSFVAFLMSFVVILIMWMNHHELLRLVRRADYPFLLANGFLLLLVTFVPFPTAVLAQYLGTPACNASAAFYCGTFVLISLGYNLLFASIARNRRLVLEHIHDAALARIRRAYYLGAAVYLIATAAAFWHASLGLLICLSLWVVWITLGYGADKMESTESAP